ncbi:PTS system protein, mannose-specific IIC component [Salmonella enterica subsp. enterica serovar Gaminara str. A4-567]|nr:PTS system protein, mannose-specific IIC component [Salmonella enterica subsp. enterica serovar Gaminara str. A4-567]
MVEALLLGLVAFIAQSEYALGTSLISRPIVTGLLTGLVLGDMETGIVMGATLELAFIGSFSVGASLPPDVVTGGILGVAFAINSGAGNYNFIPNIVFRRRGGNRAVIRFAYRDTGVNCEKYL